MATSSGSFAAFSHVLDGRILRALADLGFLKPTLVQEKAIPLALDSRDILCRARTGSGKTASYCIPVVQKILKAKSVGMPISLVLECGLTGRVQGDNAERVTRCIVLVPTKELCEQVTAHVRQLCKFCEEEVHVINLAHGTPTHLQKYIPVICST
jgi:ATP-dependent RNA helicase DDX56/DBP9